MNAFTLGLKNAFYASLNKRFIAGSQRPPAAPEVKDPIEEKVFRTQPYAHQREVFYRFKDSDFFALFMDMGTGKSKCSIDIGTYKYLKGEINAVLVIAPNHVHTQWIQEQYPAHCSVPYEAFIWESSRKGGVKYRKEFDRFITKKTGKLKVFAVNVEAFQSAGILPHIDRFVSSHRVFTVLDEATRIKSPTAVRSKNIHRIKCVSRCILTGTPTAKSPFDLWSMFEFLKRNYFGCDYFMFQHRYGIMISRSSGVFGRRFKAVLDEATYCRIKGRINKLKRRHGVLLTEHYESIAARFGVSQTNVDLIDRMDDFTRYKKLDALREYIAPDAYTVRKEECLDLPEKVYEHVYLEMSGEQKKLYETLKSQLIARYAGEELTVQNKLTLTGRLMQICGGFFPWEDSDGTRRTQKISGNVKLKRLIGEIDESDTSKPIIIWAQFVAELEEIYASLKDDYACALYYGGTPENQRNAIIRDFKEGKVKIFIGNAATAGYGLNFQHANIQLYYSNSFRTEARLQAEDRTHRIGNSGTCVYKDFIFKGTIDERVYEVLTEGRDMNDFFKSKSLSEILGGKSV